MLRQMMTPKFLQYLKYLCPRNVQCLKYGYINMSRLLSLSHRQRSCHVSKLTTVLASLASESTGHLFTSPCDLLIRIISVWENGEEFNIPGTSFVNVLFINCILSCRRVNG